MSIQASSQFTNLVWADDFTETNQLSLAKWSYQTGSGGWGNNELQTYTNNANNVYIKDGKLIISAQKDKKGNYTSARVNTKNKGDWQYGRIEVRAQLPAGRGSWPAIWLWPTNQLYGTANLANGELDIMEQVGADPGEVWASSHSYAYNPTNGNTRQCGTVIPKANSSLVTYAIEWNSQKITYSADGIVYCTLNNDNSGWKSWPYDQKYHLIINLAVGGTWGGYKGIDTKSLPWNYAIDYVHVYQ